MEEKRAAAHYLSFDVSNQFELGIFQLLVSLQELVNNNLQLKLVFDVVILLRPNSVIHLFLE
jgi:hypothetical protein